MYPRLLSHLRLLLLLVIVGLCVTPFVSSQQPPVNAQAPTLAMLVPLGMQRGTTLELVLTGTKLASPTGLWTSFPSQVVIPTDNNNGKDAAKLRVNITVPKDAPLGVHAVRLATTRGGSNLRLFCIDDLPQIQEVDTNRTKSTAQVVQVPGVVVGRADAEAADYFKVSVRAGQRLTFEVLGRRLGSALDPQITLFDGKSERELPGGHNNDSPGLQTDPRLTYTFKDAGDVIIEVRDTTYRGGADYWYRLRIGDFPCATSTLPMALQRGTTAKLQFAGPLVEGLAPVEVHAPLDPALDMVWVTPRAVNGLPGTPIAVALSDLPETLEREPNNEPAKANRIAAPGAVTGRFQDSGDIDQYVFAAKKGQRFIVECQTHEFGSPTEIYAALKDAKGAQLAATNPAQAPRLDFTAPADGDFYLVLEHLLYWSGPAETYRVTLAPYQPGFGLTLASDRIDLPQGGIATVGLQTVRRDFTGPIDVKVIGTAGIMGTATLRPGQPTPPNAPAALLFLEAKSDLPLGSFPLRVEGRATIDGKPVVEYATARATVSQALANLTYPPTHVFQGAGLAVTERVPFTLAVAWKHREGVRGLPIPLTISAIRLPGFDAEIALAAVGLPPNVGAALKNIPKGQNEIAVQFSPAANAALGQFTIGISGKASKQGTEFTTFAPAQELTLALPFDLKVEGSPIRLGQGGKGTVRVSATRKGGYDGSIAVELRNLPANVTATKTVLASGQSNGELILTASAGAAVGEKADVSVLGTATEAGKQQQSSANFAIAVVPPAIAMKVPFELSMESTTPLVVVGTQTKVRVIAKRHADYQGPITIEFQDLPPGVSAGKNTIAAGKNEVVVELSANDNAHLGEKTGVRIMGISADNRRIPTSEFKVRVTKKP